MNYISCTHVSGFGIRASSTCYVVATTLSPRPLVTVYSNS
eukprot:COSAG02_NODE_4098_length_5781_cov_13.744984_3_plen_40_part_00